MPEGLSESAAADAAGVSVIFTDGYFSSEGSLDILRDYAGYPGESGDIPDGPITLIADDDPPHAVFDGLDAETQILNSDSRATTIEDYPGDVIAQVSGAGGEPEGAGLVYRPRTPDTVEVVVTGLATSLFQGPEEEWTEDGRQLYRNLVTWAADPGTGRVSGTVTDTDGAPVRATISQVDGGQQVRSDSETGAYSIALSPGEHTLRVEALGHTPQEFAVTVTAGEVVTHDVTLERSADAVSLSGAVTSSGSVSVQSSVVDDADTQFMSIGGRKCPSGS